LELRLTLILTLWLTVRLTCRHPDRKRRPSSPLRLIRRRPLEHTLESRRKPLLRGTTDARGRPVLSGVSGCRRPWQTRLDSSHSRLGGCCMSANAKESCQLFPWWCELGRRRRHSLAEGCVGTMGNDAVFALVVRQVV
jgi:hypothetical protein